MESILYELDNISNYGINRKYIDGDDITINETNDDLANIIHNHLHLMTSEELRLFAMKCCNEKDFKKILLRYEMENYIETKNNDISLDDFIKKVNKIIHRYHHKAGGYYLEDTIWTLHRAETSKYFLTKNKAIFENTLNKINADDIETNIFLELLLNRLNSISDNIKVKLRFKDNRKDKIYYVIFKIIDLREEIENTTPEL